MSWYKSGSVNIEQGSKIVTGIDTKWANPLIGVCSGQMFILKTKNSIEICEIASVQSDTQLTLANEYNGETKAGVNYEIPTSPKVSIEALALRISEMLNYYQTQLDAWQMILTSDDEVTLTAPDGQQVTIKSQYAISNEFFELLEQSRGYTELSAHNAANAKNASSLAANSAELAKNNADNANKSADLANKYVTVVRSLIKQSAENVTESQTSADNAAKSALDAKNAALSINSSNFIQKIGVEHQAINGSLDVNQLTINGEKVYSIINKPIADDIGALPVNKIVLDGVPIYLIDHHVVLKDTIGDQRLMPFRRNELPFGWYFKNGDNFLLNSPQGKVLNNLSYNYKFDHRITIKTINGQQYINVPTAFATDGRGYFERAVNGTARQVGNIENDAIRNIKGSLPNGASKAIIGHENINKGDRDGAISIYHCDDDWLQVGNRRMRWAFFDIDASRVVPTANENRPLNIGMTPAIYLGV